MTTLLTATAGWYDRAVAAVSHLDGAVSLTLRLIVAPALIGAGLIKLTGNNWFGNVVDQFPFPFNLLPVELSWFLASWTEFLGGIALLLGLGTRLVAIPLAITMFVAGYAVHLDNGWAAIAPSRPPAMCIPASDAYTAANPAERWLRCRKVNERTIEASERLARAQEILRKHGNYRWLNGSGSLGKINNGIEFAAIYFAMLLALVIIGGGRYLSLDYYIHRLLRRSRTAPA